MAFTSHVQMAAHLTFRTQRNSEDLVAAGNAVQGGGHSHSSSALLVRQFSLHMATLDAHNCSFILHLHVSRPAL